MYHILAVRNIVAFYAPGTAEHETKNFNKAMDKNEEGFRFLKRKFSKLSEAKIKVGVFQAPQI